MAFQRITTNPTNPEVFLADAAPDPGNAELVAASVSSLYLQRNGPSGLLVWQKYGASDWRVNDAEEVFNVKAFGARGNYDQASGQGADDSAAINAAITAAITVAGDQRRGATVFIPKGNYKITQLLLVKNVYGLRIIGDGIGATRLYWAGNNTLAMFAFQNTQSCSMESLTIEAQEVLHAGVRIGRLEAPNGPPANITPTSALFRRVHIRGGGGRLRFGFYMAPYTGAQPDEAPPVAEGTYKDENNEHHVFLECVVVDYTDAGWVIGHSQSKTHRMLNCGFSGYPGSESAAAGKNGVRCVAGSFSWFNGGGGQNAASDFLLQNATDPIDIKGGDFENSARLLHITGPTGAPWAVRIENTRWDSFNLPPDRKMIMQWGPGPLTLVGNQFGADNGRPPRIWIYGGVEVCHLICEGNDFANKNSSLESPFEIDNTAGHVKIDSRRNVFCDVSGGATRLDTFEAGDTTPSIFGEESFYTAGAAYNVGGVYSVPDWAPSHSYNRKSIPRDAVQANGRIYLSVLPPYWMPQTAYAVGALVRSKDYVYEATVAGTSGTTEPTHTSGTATDGQPGTAVTWRFVRRNDADPMSGSVAPSHQSGLRLDGTVVWQFQGQAGRTVIRGFDDGWEGKRIVVNVVDDNTAFAHAASEEKAVALLLDGNVDWYAPKGASIEFVHGYDPTRDDRLGAWREVGRCDPSKRQIFTGTLADISQLEYDLGGRSKLLAVYDARHRVTATGSTLTAWDDARGVTGFGPRLAAVAGREPTWNSSLSQVEFVKSANDYLLGTGSGLLTGPEPVAIVLVGEFARDSSGDQSWATLDESSTGNFTLGVQQRADGRYNVFYGHPYSDFYAAEQAAVATGRHVLFVDRHRIGNAPAYANTKISIAFDRAPEVFVETANVTVTPPNRLTIAARNDLDQFSDATMKLRALLVLNAELTEARKETIRKWANAFHGTPA
jgi:hypothetical protein